MNILLITQYFWPENFRINDIAQGLKEMGNEVTIFTGLPNYPKGNFFKNYSLIGPYSEYYNNLKVIRSPLLPRKNGTSFNLMLNYFSFAFFSSLRVLTLKNKYDVIFVFQPSPLTVVIPAIFTKYRFKIPIVLWAQDLWPQSVIDAGGISNRSILWILNRFSLLVYKKSDLILVQSKGFVEPMKKQGADDKKIHFLPNTIEDYFRIKSKSKKHSKFFTITYAGNIGAAQDLTTLVKAIKVLKHNKINIKIQLIGDGRERLNLEKLIKNERVKDYFKFIGQIPAKDVPKFYNESDALFLSLSNKPTFKTVIPSKLQSYLASGKPILGAISGSGKKIIEESKSGMCVDAGDYVGLSKKINIMINLSSNELNKMGKSGRDYFERNFSRNVILTELEKMLKKVL